MEIKDILRALTDMEVIDLSHRLVEGMPHWVTDPAYKHDVVQSSDLGDMFTHYKISIDEHGSTHMDAPRHRFAGMKHIDEILLSDCYGRALKIDATQLAANESVTAGFIRAWESDHQLIQTDDIILFHFGWDRLWQVPEAFLGGWPGLSKDAANYLAAKHIKTVGTDALSIDKGDSMDYPTHSILMQQEIIIIENLTNLEVLPEESLFLAVPLKLESGSGSPVRAMAWVKS